MSFILEGILNEEVRIGISVTGMRHESKYRKQKAVEVYFY